MNDKSGNKNRFKYSDQKQLRFNEAHNRLTSNCRHDEYLQFKLSDLINLNESFVIDHLYAQFQPNSKHINLIYWPPMESNSPLTPENSLLLTSKLLFNASLLLNETANWNGTGNGSNVNLMLADFYLRASKQNHLSKYNCASKCGFSLLLNNMLFNFVLSLCVLNYL